MGIEERRMAAREQNLAAGIAYGIQALHRGGHLGDLMSFFERRGVPGLTEDDLRTLWEKCQELFRWRIADADGLFFETLAKLAKVDAGLWPAVGKRKAWLKKLATNIFKDSVKAEERRRKRERENAHRQSNGRMRRNGKARRASSEAEADGETVAEAWDKHSDSQSESPTALIVRRVLRESCTLTMQRVAELKAAGFSYADIAESTGITEEEARQLWAKVKKVFRETWVRQVA